MLTNKHLTLNKKKESVFTDSFFLYTFTAFLSIKNTNFTANLSAPSTPFTSAYYAH